MSILKVVAIRDRAIDAFGQPAFVPTLGAAVRGFGDEVNNRESALNAHPEDYDLYHLADFDNESGKFQQLEQPRQIAIGKDLVQGARG